MFTMTPLIFLKKTFLLLIVFLQTSPLWSQQDKNVTFQIQLDSRNTFVSNEAVGVFGIRGGLLFNNKFELGVGVYGSRLFNRLGTEIRKNYVDNSVTPAQTLPARIGFDYLSIYGELTVLESNRWMVTANSQVGAGRVNIRTTDINQNEQLKREGKSLIEHSVKVKYGVLPWLDLIGGFGYRYLLGGEKQIKKAFNAPIYIVSTEIDFKELMKVFKKKK